MLDATTREAVARHQADWSADVAAYDAVHVQALAMADMLSAGIIAQFPRLFMSWGRRRFATPSPEPAAIVRFCPQSVELTSVAWGRAFR
jgi:hypothetical protein